MQHAPAQLLDTLHRCALTCDQCYEACLTESDVQMKIACIASCRDCADICHLTASFVARGAQVQAQVLSLCAEVCRVCAEECERHADMDEHCRICAEACRQCEAACREASGVTRVR